MYSFFGIDISKIFPEPEKDEFQKRGWNKLGCGYYLVPIEEENNRDKYSHLYKGEEKLSDLIFRQGGLGANWKGDYIDLILYTKKPRPRTGKPPKPDESKTVYDSGVHCIVDKTGKVVYKAAGLQYPCLYGGCLMSINNTIRNLKTDSEVVKYDGTSMKSDKYLFVQNNYNKEYPLGVYKIEYETGEVEVFNISK